jgi:hypothetical protein
MGVALWLIGMSMLSVAMMWYIAVMSVFIIKAVRIVLLRVLSTV